MVAIPQSGLLAQVNSLWLHAGHSGPNLTKHCSQCLPRLLAQPPLASGGCRCLHSFSAGGVTVGLIICWFYLFFLPVMLPAVLPRLATDWAASVSWCLETSLPKIPFPGWSSLPTSFVSFFFFCIFSYPFLKTMICFSGCLMSSASIQKLFCVIYSALKCSFDEFMREKVVSPSYSSAILRSPSASFLYIEDNKKNPTSPDGYED